MVHYVIEAIVVGIVTVIIGFPLSYMLMYLNNPSFKFDFKGLFSLNLFLIGFFAHVILEVLGVNKKYCSIGYACQEK